MKKAPPKRPAVEPDNGPLLKAWEDRRTEMVAGLQSESDEAARKVDHCHTLLEAEQEWINKKEARDAQLATLLAKSPGLPKVSVQVAQLQREYGAAESEKAFATREESHAKSAYESLVGQGANVLCESCGQGVPAATLEQYTDAAERRVMASGAQVRTFEARLSNIGSQLHELNSGGGAEREAIETSIDECRSAIAECDVASKAFAKIRSNRDEAALVRECADRKIADAGKEENPFSGAS